MKRFMALAIGVLLCGSAFARAPKAGPAKNGASQWMQIRTLMFPNLSFNRGPKNGWFVTPENFRPVGRAKLTPPLARIYDRLTKQNVGVSPEPALSGKIGNKRVFIFDVHDYKTENTARYIFDRSGKRLNK